MNTEWMKGVAASVLAGAIMAGVGVYSTTQTNVAVINKLTESTDKLSEAVTELRITVGRQDERFITKDEFNTAISELKEKTYAR